jgi:hypothetical protein
MTKSLTLLVLISLAFSAFAAGCKSEAKIDEDGAKAEIKPK